MRLSKNSEQYTVTEISGNTEECKAFNKKEVNEVYVYS